MSVVRAERLNNCFSSNNLKWCLRVHPHFAGQFVLETVNPYVENEWCIIKTGTYTEVKAFAQDQFAASYESELSMLFENVDDTLCYRNQRDDSLMTYDDYIDRCFDLHLERDCTMDEVITNDDDYVRVLIDKETNEERIIEQ